MKDLGTRIAQYQFWLSLLVIGGVLTLLIFQGLHKLDASITDKAFELAMLVCVYWFQRQRHSDSSVPNYPPPKTDGDKS